MSGGGNAENGCTDEAKLSTFELLTSSINLLQDLGILRPPKDMPVVEFNHPASLKKKIDLSLNEPVEDVERIVKLCEDVIRYSVVTNHPHFHNQLYGGTDPFGLAGSFITEALNTNQENAFRHSQPLEGGDWDMWDSAIRAIPTKKPGEPSGSFIRVPEKSTRVKNTSKDGPRSALAALSPHRREKRSGDLVLAPISGRCGLTHPTVAIDFVVLGPHPTTHRQHKYTFEVAPVFTLCEHIIIQRFLQMVGFEEGDGIFVPGGSLNNMYAMALARHRLEPQIKQKGLYCLKTIVAFTSEDSHYSIQKGVNWLGIGTDNLVKVKTDEKGKMIPTELEKMILRTLEEGKLPFFVNATAGTTVFGAFDAIEEIADICKKYNMWLHVDACWGGSLIFSRKHSKVLEGLHRVDSVAWNAHKMLGAPLQCSIFVTKHKGLLHQCNCASASYLFQQDKFYDVSYDTGDKSIQCGRKVDAFKLWLMWKVRGNSGFEKLVDQAMACSIYFKNQIADREGFKLILPEFQCTNICFWYIPKRLRNMKESEEWWEEIGKVAPQIKEKLTYAGTLMIGYQPLSHKNLKNFFRFVTTCHPERTFDEMDHVIEQIEFHGENL